MSNLDDRIRDSHQRILHASPSEAGWQRLRQDLGNPPPRRRFPLGFVGGVLLGVLAGAACVFGLGQFTKDTAVQIPPCPQVIAAPPPAEKPSAAAAPGSALPLTSPVRRAAPRTTIQRVADVVPTPVSFRELLVDSVVTQGQVPAAPIDIQPFDPPSLAVAQLPHGTMIGQRQVRSQRMARPIALDTSAAPLPFTADTTAPVAERKYVFQRVPSQHQPAPRWEIGGSVFAIPTRQPYYAAAISKTPRVPGEDGFIASIDGEVDTFYWQNITGMVKDRQLIGTRAASLEIARQFPSGLRLGGGLLGVLEGTTNYRQKTALFRELGQGNEYTEVATSSFRTLYAAVVLQYTFFRRRRFRVSPGISLAGRVMTTNVSSLYRYREGGPPQENQGEQYRRAGRWSEVAFLPSLQLQYQLGRHLSLTADAIPGLGLGLRYGISQPPPDR